MNLFIAITPNYLNCPATSAPTLLRVVITSSDKLPFLIDSSVARSSLSREVR
ncbi:MAG: hypothetical protein IPO98_01725 [Saprospiraceae bacterium]|nr:hypothetical protein [Saprospiraceae bacterium]